MPIIKEGGGSNVQVPDLKNKLRDFWRAVCKRKKWQPFEPKQYIRQLLKQETTIITQETKPKHVNFHDTKMVVINTKKRKKCLSENMRLTMLTFQNKRTQK